MHGHEYYVSLSRFIFNLILLKGKIVDPRHCGTRFNPGQSCTRQIRPSQARLSLVERLVKGELREASCRQAMPPKDLKVIVNQ
jgi:hypothetical protein